MDNTIRTLLGDMWDPGATVTIGRKPKRTEDAHKNRMKREKSRMASKRARKARALNRRIG